LIGETVIIGLKLAKNTEVNRKSDIFELTKTDLSFPKGSNIQYHEKNHSPVTFKPVYG
jgi:hypothetical protein